MTFDAQIRQIMHEAVNHIRRRLEEKNINASGRTSESFQVRRVSEGKYQIIQYGSRIAPAETLEKGRPAGKVPKGFYYILKQWSIDKGLNFESERERGTFAYFLARRIAREGTMRSWAGNHVRVFAPVKMVVTKKLKKLTRSELDFYARRTISLAAQGKFNNSKFLK